MNTSERRFDSLLYHIRSDELKTIARAFGGSSSLRKDDAVAFIQRALADPAHLKGVVASLSEWERNALAFIKQAGGMMELDALAVTLRVSGVPLPHAQRIYADRLAEPVQQLIRRGLVLTTNAYDPSQIAGYGINLVFSDERLLAHVATPESKPFQIQPARPPDSTTYRRPQTVVLDIITILQTIDEMGGLSMTQAGAIRANDVRKLLKTLKWDPEQIEVDGLPFREPATAFAGALQHSGLLVLEAGRLGVKGTPDQFAARPYVEQVKALWRGFVATTNWQEAELRDWYGVEQRYLGQGRHALSSALAALPVGSEAFFMIDDLSQALFERIGEYFALDYPPQRPYHFNETPEQIRKADLKWSAQIKASWQKQERPWIESGLTSWLYYLGLVELGMQKGKPVSVRLTELGRALFHPELKTLLQTTTQETRSAWVVQPNFDIVVYLDRATPKQLAFLERHAERIKAQQHTAQYRLTRESAYRGLESGTPLEQLLSGLQKGSGTPLPANVVTELREWGARREKLTLYRRARLLEFSDAQARQAALNAHVTGTPVGDRFLLLNAGKLDSRRVKTTIDYADPPERCLSVTEQGAMRVSKHTHDLLIESQLEHWAERGADGKWQLTETSVRAAVRAGARVGELLTLLRERLTHPVPPLLAIAVRAWAGERLPAQVASVTVLRCPQPDVFGAIAHSKTFRPYLAGELAPDTLLVDTARLADLRAELSRLGLRVSDELTLEEPE